MAVRTPAGERRGRASAPAGDRARDGQRRRLARLDVIVAAEHLVDDEGWDGLTMARLAAALDVKAPSLYTHVRGLEDVRGELQVRAMREMAAELRQVAMGRTGPDGFRALAASVRSFARRHPRRYDGMTRAAHDRDALFDAATGASEALLAVLGTDGVDEGELLTIFATAFAALHGVIALEITGFFGDGIDVGPVYERVVESVLLSLADVMGEEPLRSSPSSEPIQPSAKAAEQRTKRTRGKA